MIYNKISTEKFDVIIVGGSYAGLAAALGLGRALRRALVIDSGKPANRYTPHSHNFLTQDGMRPFEIASVAAMQVDRYETVTRLHGEVSNAKQLEDGGFQITLTDDSRFVASKLIFSTGIVDMFPDITGFAECWGKSVLHCPYCHGYEVRDTKTGILGNGGYAFEFGSLISNWTRDLTIYTDGPSTLSVEQASRLQGHNIAIVEKPIEQLLHKRGYVEKIVFGDETSTAVQTIYARPEFQQYCDLPKKLGCEITPEGYLKVDAMQRTTVPGIYACGDNVTRMRTVANAVAMGTTAALTTNKDIISQTF